MKRILPFLEGVIFNARYLLVASYIVLGLITVFYWPWLILHGKGEEGVLGVLAGLDGVMVANTAYLILAGSYIVFVKGRLSDKIFPTPNDRPPAFQHLTPNSLKKKMAASLVGVSSVDLIQVLLKAGRETEQISHDALMTKVGIHLLLIIGFVAFQWADSKENQEDHHA